MPAAARISVQPGPAGFTFWQKEISVARSVCGPTYAVMSHDNVVRPTWIMVVVAKSACGMKNGTATEVTSDITMATTSHQAETRHQNQRAT